ncbi:MAG TPA: hypothetical protein VNV87_04520 [Acidimicrobiales bacterium]|jgi:hypothetical protein|nr:hypothetical protein [Acidimicrobiales bacterium]
MTTAERLTSATDKEQLLVSRLRTLFSYARDQKRVRYETWQRNYRIVHNRLNLPSVSSWMPGPRDSEVYPVLSSLIAWMTDQSPSIDVVPAADPTSSMYPFVAQTAIDLSTVLNSLWVADSFNVPVKLALWDAAMYGIGILKSVWDNSAAGGLGNAKLLRVDPYSFYPDPRATSFDDAEFFVEARELTFEQIERMYPDASIILSASGGGDDVIDSRPDLGSDMGAQPKTGPGVVIPGSGTYGSVGANAHNYLNRRVTRPDGEVAPTTRYRVYEFWLRENDEWFDDDGPDDDQPIYSDRHVEDTWRVVVVCRGMVLMDEDASDLWSHGSHPYSRFVADDVGEMFGIALVDHISHPQLYLNRLINALQHNTELTGNPVLIEAENSGSSRTTITNRPGARISIKGAAGMANAPQWMTPPSMPAIAMDLAQFWIGRIENTSGLSDLQKGKAPNQRSAQGTISQVQEAAFVRVRSALTNLEDTLRDAAYKLSDLIIDNYDAPRTMAVVGPEGQSTSLSLAGHHFQLPTSSGAIPLKYMLLVEAGSTTATSSDARRHDAQTLSALGVVDDQYVLEAFKVRNPDKILKRLYAKRQQGVIGSGAGQRQRSARTGA